MSFDVDTAIDKNNLDDGWVKQADLYDEYSTNTAKAFETYLTLKNIYKVKRAEKEMKVRRGTIDIGCKITEGAISSFLDSDPGLSELDSQIIKAKYEYDLYSSAVDALEHKKRSLENLTKLHLNNYYFEDDFTKKVREKM